MKTVLFTRAPQSEVLWRAELHGSRIHWTVRKLMGYLCTPPLCSLKTPAWVHLWDILKFSMLYWESSFRSYDSDSCYTSQILQFKANITIIYLWGMKLWKALSCCGITNFPYAFWTHAFSNQDIPQVRSPWRHAVKMICYKTTSTPLKVAFIRSEHWVKTGRRISPWGHLKMSVRVRPFSFTALTNISC